MATTYPRKNENGDTVWACCESSIGPVCNHLRCPEEWTDFFGDEEHRCTLTINHSDLCVCRCGHNKKGQWVGSMSKKTAKHSCMGCDKLIPANKTICASCAEDMGYSRRAR